MTTDLRVPCPHCGEEIAAIARKCKHCGERVGEERHVPIGPGAFSGALLGAVLVLVLLAGGAVLGAVAWPNVVRLRKQAHEAEAIAALQAIARAQEQLHARGGLDHPPGTYGDLEALGRAGLLSPQLASGLQGGYAFEVSASSAEPEARWIATASPIAAEVGERHFAANHTGAVFYRFGGPMAADLVTCEPPAEALPLGAGVATSPTSR